MNSRGHFLESLALGFPDLPPRRALQRLVYWGVIVLMSLVIGFTSYYLQAIPDRLLGEARNLLSPHPWLQSKVYVDGRDLSLRGEVEPGADLEVDIQRLREIAGVGTVTNQLDIVPRPTPRLVIGWNGENVNLAGSLSGNDLDQVIRGVREGFPMAGIRDRIRIDDRLGHPLWVDRLAAMMTSLSDLPGFTFFAWRDRILVDGVADSVDQMDRIRYRTPAELDPAVTLSFRLRPSASADTAAVSLLSGWNGSALTVVADNASAIEKLRRSASQNLAVAQDMNVSVQVNDSRATPTWFGSLSKVLPSLGQVHDLHLTSADGGLWLWGRVDDARTLGMIHTTLADAGLADIVQSRLEVSPAGRPAEISLFKDRSRAVVSGRLPNPQSLGVLLDTLGEGLDVSAIENFISLEPNTGFSPWLDRWPVLLPVLPESPFGLTVSGNRALVSGELPSEDAYRTLIRALESMLPDMILVDWLTVAADD